MKGPAPVIITAAAVTSALLLTHAARAVELYNNGTFVTGTSPGGNTISEVPAGYDTFGLVAGGYNTIAPQRVADNFNVTSGGWDLNTLTVFAYEGGGAVNTFSSAYVAIFDCDPTGTEDLTPRWGSLDPATAPNAFVSQHASTSSTRILGATVCAMQCDSCLDEQLRRTRIFTRPRASTSTLACDHTTSANTRVMS